MPARAAPPRRVIPAEQLDELCALWLAGVPESRLRVICRERFGLSPGGAKKRMRIVRRVVGDDAYRQRSEEILLAELERARKIADAPEAKPGERVQATRACVDIAERLAWLHGAHEPRGIELDLTMRTKHTIELRWHRDDERVIEASAAPLEIEAPEDAK